MNGRTLLLFLFIPCCVLRSQELSFRHLSAEEGLSQNTINCIYQDHFGFMWFGTQDGLNCYNGYEITVYRHDPADSTTLSHSWIWDIIEDDDFNLWIATWNGLSKYDRNAGIFIRYLPDSSDCHSIRGTRPASMVKDHRGRLWIATWGGGLNLYDPVTEQFSVFSEATNPGKGYPGDYTRKLFYDRSGTLWVGTWDGLFRCRPEEINNLVFECFRRDPRDPGSISSNRITAFEQEPDGTLWIGTLGGGINRFDTLPGTFSRYLHQKSDPFSLSSNDITSLETGTDGSLWIGTVSSGLNRFRKAEKRFIRDHHDKNDAFTLLADAVYSIYKSRDGMVWVGAGGLNLYHPELTNFHCSCALATLIEGVKNINVNALFEDSQGYLWAGTQASGLYLFDPKHEKTVHYRYDPDNPTSLSHNDVSAIAEDRTGSIWVATRGGGLNKFDRSAERFTHFREREGKPETAGLNYISGLVIDDSDNLWIATSDNGVIRFNPGKDHYESFRSVPNDPNTLSGDYLLRIFLDSRGDIWIGSWGGGLNRLNPATGLFTRFLSTQGDSLSLPGNIIHSIYETIEHGKRTLWIGTENGLATLDPDQTEKGFQQPDINRRLPVKSIYGILPDTLDNIWLSSTSGLFRFNRNDGTLKMYDSRDGLPNNEFNAGTFLELRTGEFVFGSSSGLLIFEPANTSESTYEPEIAFTAFSVLNLKIYDGIRLNTMESIKLSYKENFISFEFASMDFSDPGKNRFQYKLEGLDANWIESGNRHYASYTDLDPGRYRFVVKGTNSDEVWSSDEASIHIVITPPFWQRWWFRGLLLLMVVLLFLFLHLYRVNRIREIERLRIRIASDLHDDVGSALTRIGIHSQQMTAEMNESHIAETCAKINTLSREVISTMSDIVWSIDARNDRMEDLLERMMDFAHGALSEKEIAVTFDHHGLDTDRTIPIRVRQNLYYIFKESINNIVKHSGATAVKIKIDNREPSFTLSVSDNGKGYDSGVQSRGNGLRNMKMRAGQIGAKLETDSSDGVTITLQMKHL
ncbi:MAG: hypothetical protein JXR52_05945 [Bacteroidales bacterium]|nr:hypothetical protein [Bacteroidales bacterium]